MRINQHTCVFTDKVVLVPYSAHHVPKYHEWMKDPEIQQATASEPLTIEEEFAMQRTWREDADKLTFIVCEPFAAVIATAQNEDAHRDENVEGHAVSIDRVAASLQDEIAAMIGDVNLFISEWEDEEEPECDNGILHDRTARPGQIVGELELMIAQGAQQGKGYGKAALLLFLEYILQNEGAILHEYQHTMTTQARASTLSSHATNSPLVRFDHFCVKVGSTNLRSMALFGGLGFQKTSNEPSYFGEYELRLHKEGLKNSTDKGTQTYLERGYQCGCDAGTGPVQ